MVTAWVEGKSFPKGCPQIQSYYLYSKLDMECTNKS